MTAMLPVSDLVSFGAPPELVEVWSTHVQELTNVQERAVRAGALNGESNLLVTAPTSSGKTFVGEMAATSSALSRRQHAIFIVPFRALADEHYDLFRQRYGHLLTVVISTADWTEFDADIRAGNFNLAVMTYEKLMGFLVQQSGLLGQCTTLVVDEVQLLADGERGPKLEVLLTQAMLADNPPQIIALSASLDHLNRLDVWLNATLVSSAERPIPLTQSVCAPSGSALVLPPGGEVSTEQLTERQPDREALVAALVERFVAEDKQVIVFRTSIPKVIATARQLRGRLPARGLSQQAGERFSVLDDSDSINDLQLCLAAGVGFHTGDLTHPERRIVEEAFRSGEARVLVATNTVAMGVNLPGDVVIVADSTRWALVRRQWSSSNLPVSEYRNASGRAGRLGLRTEGFSVLVAENEIEQRQLVTSYLLGPVEGVESQIPKRPLADTVFGIMCAQLADNDDGIVDFIASTFAFLTFYDELGGGIDTVRAAVTAAVSACVDSGLVIRDRPRLLPTPLARVFGAAGLSLASATRLAAVLDEATAAPPSRQDLLFEVASCPEVGIHPWLQRLGRVELDPRPQHAPDGADSSPGSRLAATLAKPVIGDEERKALVRTRCLLEWTSGADYRSITTMFKDMGAAAARVRDLGKYAAWLLDALAEAARLDAAPAALQDQLRTLALEARYGVPAPLAPLARLTVPGISRAHLIRLYGAQDADLIDPETILDTPDDRFDGLLTPLQLNRLRQAILAEIDESIRRKHAGQVARAEQTDLPRRLIDDLYSAKGGGLEQAIADALNHIGLAATRVQRQPHGEEDIRVAHHDGTVIISVTARDDDSRPASWNKAKEILGAGVGLNPINYVCVARPGFDTLAERNANGIARESGSRSLLLVPLPVLAEAFVRVAEGTLTSKQLGEVLARSAGVFTVDDLPTAQP